MCSTCGCGGDAVVEHEHPSHAYRPRKRAAKPNLPAATRRIVVEEDLLARNDAMAGENRAALAQRGVFAINLVSSPGSGKTSLLVETLRRLAGELPVAVIEGDQQTSRDADRIRATGVAAIQVNTGKGCHLDAGMVARALEGLPPIDGGLLLIENVGNLVCPAAFDLGEAHKVVILSVTEGEDKPLKYPDMFRAADLMLLNKCDLLPHLNFDVEQAEDFARRVNPEIRILHTSAVSGDGLEPWLDWLRAGAIAEVRERTVKCVGRATSRSAWPWQGRPRALPWPRGSARACARRSRFARRSSSSGVR